MRRKEHWFGCLLGAVLLLLVVLHLAPLGVLCLALFASLRFALLSLGAITGVLCRQVREEHLPHAVVHQELFGDNQQNKPQIRIC